MLLNRRHIGKAKFPKSSSGKKQQRGKLPSIIVLILNYNGGKLLDKSVPSIMAAASVYGGRTRIVMIDNQSTDGSVALVAAKFPKVEVIPHANDFLFSFNDVLGHSQSDIAVLLNNDVIVQKDFILPLVSHFEDADVFAVGPKQLSWEFHEFQLGALTATVDNLTFAPKVITQFEFAIYSLYISGCAFAVNIEKFNDLNGFDHTFSPYYFEDTDLCVRAWDKGWKVVYEPKSVVMHKHYGVMGAEISRDYRELVYLRNLAVITCGFPVSFGARLTILLKTYVMAIKSFASSIGFSKVSVLIAKSLKNMMGKQRYMHYPEQYLLVGTRAANPISRNRESGKMSRTRLQTNASDH